jgi:hypothetical protein
MECANAPYKTTPCSSDKHICKGCGQVFCTNHLQHDHKCSRAHCTNRAIIGDRCGYHGDRRLFP